MQISKSTVGTQRLLRRQIIAFLVALICAICASGGSRARAAQKPQHTGTKVEGFATVVTADSILLFDKKSNHEILIHTDKDYTSLVAIATPVTVWYTTANGANHLEDIVYAQGGAFVPADRLRDGIKRIIILPQPQDVNNTDGLIAAVSKYLADSAGWYVAPPELAQEIVLHGKSSAASLDAIDPNTGTVDMEKYLQAQRALVTVVANETRSDAVLEVRILKVKAKVRGSVANWDDMTESVVPRQGRGFAPLGFIGSKGWVYAATADMTLWSQSGKLLWQKRRGFAVLGVQAGMGSQYRERPLTEVYQNGDAMRHWLDATLGPLVAGPR
jgi:hypothetical protein